ncbi:MAG: S41 family peptidase [Bacteroidales bacterium]|nr:S41 family peptidase [Bacteroidales bacterium]
MKNLFTNKIRKTAIIVVISCVAFFSVSFIHNDFEIAKNIDIFSSVIKELHLNYVDPINAGDLVKKAIDSMLESLDPYTVYYPESDIEEYRLLTTGQYGGIGAVIQQKEEYVIIAQPYEGFPAQKSGLKPGDKIIEINGKSAKGRTTEEVSTILKGQPGTSITLKIMPYGKNETIDKEIFREEIKLPNIPYAGKIDDKIGYVRLQQFTENAAKEVKEEFMKLKEQNIDGFVLDLRGNGGGLLHEAVLIMNLFVDRDNLIVYTKGKTTERNAQYKTMFPVLDNQIPIVVLINESSASASEIVAGAFQDLDRGLVVGERTFGKGLVQNVVPLPYNSRLKVTISKYYIPSGRCIQAIDYSGNDRRRLSDSTYIAFKTKNGRTVYDKGGIEPDVKITNPTFSKIASSLYGKNIIFDFVNEFQLKNASIPQPSSFEISDALFEEFVEYIKDKDYDYETETEMALKTLNKTAKKEQYLEAIQEEIKNLETKIKHNKEEDVYTFKKEIIELLQAEIVSRYYFQKGQIEVMLKSDNEIKKAIELLKNKDEYNSLLKGKK